MPRIRFLSYLSHAALVMTVSLVEVIQVHSVNTDTATGAAYDLLQCNYWFWYCCRNYVFALDVAAAVLVTATAVQYGFFNNMYNGDAGGSGYILPAIGTN